MKNITDYSAVVSLDWGDTQHAFALRIQGRQEVRAGTLAAAPEALHAWLEQLGNECQNRPVLLVLEAGNNNLLAALCEHPFIETCPVHPGQSAKFRKALRPSGAKDDPDDAASLLEFAEKHHKHLRRYLRDGEAVRELSLLTKSRRALVEELTRATNQLRSTLKTYYPQALQLAGVDLAAPMALKFLRTWPRLETLKKAGAQKLRDFYLKNNVRSKTRIEERVRVLENARALTTDNARINAGMMMMRAQLGMIETLNKNIALHDARIGQVFATHPKARLFATLPGAGPVMAPRLLALFGDNDERYPDAKSLQCHAAVAPVREKSGKRTIVHWRYAAPRFARQSLVEWAGQTAVYCRWAGEYYRRQKQAGKTRGMILRALAFKWVAILWRCWKDNRAYDDQLYEQCLRTRRSPLALHPQNI